jgi:hypothetical protein
MELRILDLVVWLLDPSKWRQRLVTASAGGLLGGVLFARAVSLAPEARDARAAERDRHAAQIAERRAARRERIAAASRTN